LLFSSTYTCEHIFSRMKIVKSKTILRPIRDQYRYLTKYCPFSCISHSTAYRQRHMGENGSRTVFCMRVTVLIWSLMGRSIEHSSSIGWHLLGKFAENYIVSNLIKYRRVRYWKTMSVITLKIKLIICNSKLKYVNNNPYHVF